MYLIAKTGVIDIYWIQFLFCPAPLSRFELSLFLIFPPLLKQVFKEISKDDYFAKNNEFATWLKEEKGKYFSDLSSESARDLFLKFVKQWNKGKLPSQYYEGITSGPRSAHNWNIKAWGMFSFIVVCSMRHLVFSWRDFHLVVVYQTTSTTTFDLIGYCKADVKNVFLKEEGKS